MKLVFYLPLITRQFSHIFCKTSSAILEVVNLRSAEAEKFINKFQNIEIS